MRMARTICRGTIIGKNADPRIVEVDGESIEARPVDTLLVVRNLDKPGIVGKVGTVLGEYGVNIANMSLADPRFRIRPYHLGT